MAKQACWIEWGGLMMLLSAACHKIASVREDATYQGQPAFITNIDLV